MDADGTPTHASLGYHTLMFCQQTIERQNIHKEGIGWREDKQTMVRASDSDATTNFYSPCRMSRCE
jgi:hypothetical protein